MSPRARLLIACLVPIVYVGIAAVRSSGGGAFSIAALVALPFCVTLAFRFTDPKTVGEDLVGDGPRTAIRVAVLGASLYVAARTSAVGRAAFDAIAAAGVGTATAAALYGLARVPETRSLLAPPPSTSRLDGVFAMVLAAAIATTVPAVAALSPTRGGAIDPLTIDYALVAESACALVLLTAASLRFRVGRRLELGAADRGVAALAVAGTALCVAAPAAALGFAAPDRILPAAALLASLAVATVLVVSDARLVGRALRTLLVVCIMASPIALLTAGMAAAAPRQSGGVVLGASVVLVLVGVLGHRIAARMRPESARWLAALERAQESAAIPEPYSALRGTLFALREQLGPSAPSPVLFRTEAGDTLTVDRAGYLHEAKGAAPPTVFGFCDAEPEHTFRIEVARALEVTRPDVRPTLAWMEAHDFAAVTSLRDDDGPVGLLAMPRSGRRAPLTLEEVLALSRLTERMSAVFSLASSLANARTRQLEAEEAEKRALAKVAELAREIGREDERWAAQARRAARRSPAARYSPAARLAEAEMARVAGDARPLVLLCPPGVAADGFAALHHLGGPRKNGPFIVADGADAREHGIALWTDETTSPLWLARGGTLVVLDVAALPADVQSLLAGVARAQEAPRVDGSATPPHDVALVLTVRETVDVLYARGRIVEELADALGDRAVPLPPLAARPEDVRAIALDHLARLGNALRGSPLGLADDALARLFEEPFPGNDEELAAMLLRAAVRAKGAVVTAADLGSERGDASDGPVEESAVFRARASSRPPRRRLRPSAAAPRPLLGYNAARAMPSSPVAHTPVLVLGAGLSGLSAAIHLTEAGARFRHVERLGHVGGHAITIEDEGFRFDRTGHLLHLRDPDLAKRVLRWIGDDHLTVQRRSFVFSHGVYTRYPFQANTYGLPPHVAYECLLGFLEAQGRTYEAPPRDFEEYCLRTFGEGIAKHFMIPYNARLWGVHPREITAAWCQRFVPVPRLEDVVAGAVGLNDRELGYNASFVYPRRGIGELPRAMARDTQSVELGRAPSAIDWRARRAIFADEVIAYETLLSTAPLDVLGRLLVDPPAPVAAAFARLRKNGLYYLDVALERAPEKDLHWAYVPEESFPFYRVGCYSAFSPALAPEGTASLYVELVDRAPPDEATLIPRVIDALARMSLARGPQDVRFVRVRHIEHAYVLFDHAYYDALAVIFPFLAEASIVSTGRYGGWNYSSMEDALRFGREAALAAVGTPT